MQYASCVEDRPVADTESHFSTVSLPVLAEQYLMSSEFAGS